MLRLRTFWYHLLAVSVLAAGSTTAGESDGSISLSLQLDGQYEDHSSTPSNHRVFVGASGALRFRPQHVDAAVGDLITFEFLALNHSIKQSSFDSPCASDGGFDTEFWQYNPSNDSRHTVDMLVTTTTPQWFYCQQTIPWPHCTAGMVFAVNPGAHWEEFLARAQHHPSGGSTADNTASAGTATTTSMSYTYDPQKSSSICGPATSSATKPFTSLPTVIVPSDTTSQSLERRTLVVGGRGSGYIHGDGSFPGGTAVDSWLGNSQPLGPVITAASGLVTGLSTGAIIGTASSLATGACGSNASTTSTWRWPSRTATPPSVQSATALSSASYSVGRVGVAFIATLPVFVIVHLISFG